jgi:hypothetical protein
MRLKGYLLLAALTLGLAGCKPDAAVQHGSTIDSSTGTPGEQKQADEPTVIPSKTNKSQPLNRVQ